MELFLTCGAACSLWCFGGFKKNEEVSIDPQDGEAKDLLPEVGKRTVVADEKRLHI